MSQSKIPEKKEDWDIVGWVGHKEGTKTFYVTMDNHDLLGFFLVDGVEKLLKGQIRGIPIKKAVVK